MEPDAQASRRHEAHAHSNYLVSRHSADAVTTLTTAKPRACSRSLGSTNWPLHDPRDTVRRAICLPKAMLPGDFPCGFACLCLKHCLSRLVFAGHFASKSSVQ